MNDVGFAVVREVSSISLVEVFVEGSGTYWVRFLSDSSSVLPLLEKLFAEMLR